MRVFIGGSRELTSLSSDVQARLDNIVQQEFTVLVGDANGIDRTVQQHLLGQAYRQVLVYCAGARCRNNLGQWETHHVAPPHATKDFDYYAAKDTEMAVAADYGCMIWNGKSAGTLRNVLNLLQRSKTTLVYLEPQQRFQTIATGADLEKLLAFCAAADVAVFERKLKLSQTLAALAQPAASTQQLTLLT